MAKTKEPQATHQLTRRQRTQWEKQALRQRIIGIGGAVTIIAVIALIVSGWYFQQYLPITKPMNQTVVEVNGHKFSMAYYIDAIKYFDQGQTSYIPYILTTVEQNIEQVELLKEAGAKLGYTVSDTQVNQMIQANSLANNQAVRDIVRGQLLAQQLASDYFGPQIPASAEQRNVLAMFLESQSQLDQIQAQIDAGADFGQLAAANSLESTTKGDNGALGSHPSGVFDYTLSTTGLDAAIFSQQVGTWGVFQDTTTTKQVGYWLVEVTGKNSDNSQVHVSGMLLTSQEEAQSIKARLDAGEDFDTLAQQYSQNWSATSKDDLGWITSSSTAAYESYVFDTSTSIGAVSDPIKDTSQSTTGGYWLFTVQNSSVANISSTDLTDLENQAFTKWLTALQADTVNNKIIVSLDQAQQTFASNQAAA